MWKKQRIVWLLCLCLVGCGKPRLNEEQKSQVSEVMKSMGILAKSVESMGQFDQAVLSEMAFSENSEDSLSGQITAFIQDKQQKQQCSVNVSQAKQSMIGVPTMSLSIGGEKCPLEMEFSIKISGNPNDARGEFVWKLVVKDSSFQKLTDLSQLDLSGTFELKTTLEVQKAIVQFKGKVVSKAYGAIAMALGGSSFVDSEKQKVEGTLSLGFEEFSAEFVLRQEVDKRLGEVRQNYSINGEGVTEQEFLGYFINSLPGSLVPSQPTQGPATIPPGGVVAF